jgi:hypothetical protein
LSEEDQLMNTKTKRAAVLVVFLALEATGLVAWSATATTPMNVIVGAAVGLVFMVGGFILLVSSLIKLNTPAFAESTHG